MAKPRVALAFLTLTVLALAGQANASLILQDQSNLTVQLNSLQPVGQSFTAEDAKIQSIGFGVTDANIAYPIAAITLTLYEGEGLGGSVLATVSATPTLGVGYPAFVDFDCSAVPLTVGDSYTALLTTSTARWALSYKSAPAPYGGGILYASGEPAPDYDTRFHVVPLAAAEVPEPATLSLLGLGVLALLRRRRGL